MRFGQLTHLRKGPSGFVTRKPYLDHSVVDVSIILPGSNLSNSVSPKRFAVSPGVKRTLCTGWKLLAVSWMQYFTVFTYLWFSSCISSNASKSFETLNQCYYIYVAFVFVSLSDKRYGCFSDFDIFKSLLRNHWRQVRISRAAKWPWEGLLAACQADDQYRRQSS